MEQHEIIHNFTVLSSRALDELNAVLHLLRHEKSGARLVWLERPEENKTFGIAFRTQPWDDTGVFHILEHAVLCGSDRYPVKEPFVELMKSSLQTFLNAMTFPDKTFYPVSSRNEQDFIHLLRVYMDAVLHPLIYARPEIFGQEGWHYALDEDGAPACTGVVYNEMKGAFASPDTLLEREMTRRLFPDTCYRFVSGGDPAHIPELTYAQFLDAHRRFYHPSGAYLFLDGELDLGRVLQILDEEFLSAYERRPAPEAVPLQRPVDGGAAEVVYALSRQEALEGRFRLADGFVACTCRDQETLTALQALSDALCGDNQAPLKRRILERGLAQDVQLNLHGGIRQPWITLEALDVGEDRLGEVSAALREELERLVQGGLDHRRILAALDTLEFEARQRDYGPTPQGLVLGFQVLDSWLCGGEPEANLLVGTRFDDLRQKCEMGYFETLLERTLLQNPHRCRVVMRPSHTAGQELQAQEAARLRAAQAGWSAEDAAGIRQYQQAIAAWQAAPDTAEALASIPRLRLDQIPAEPEPLPLEALTVDGVAVLRHDLPAGAVAYLNFYFALDDLTAEELTKASLMAQLFGYLDTESAALAELHRQMRSLFGEIQFAVEAYGQQDTPGRCRTFLCAACSVLNEKLEQAMRFLSSFLTRQRWENQEQVLAFLRQRRTAMAEELVMEGHSAALSRVLACSTAEGAVQEQTSGITFYRWLSELEQAFPTRYPALAAELRLLARRIFCRARMTVSVTSEEAAAAEKAVRLLDLPTGTPAVPAACAIKPWGPRREGIVIPADVSFAAMGGGFPAASTGAARVLGRVLSLEHLWSAVRVQGGAYGTGMVLRNTGFAGFYSYRDPNAARTLGCYRASADFLRSAAGMDNLAGIIIGTVAESDPLLTVRRKGEAADACHWRKVTHADRCRLRREMLSATAEDLAALAAQVERLTAEGSVCVLGPQRQIEACAGLLDSVEVL